MRKAHILILLLQGAVLGLLFNITAGLFDRATAIRVTRWGWLCFLLYATYLVLATQPVKRAALRLRSLFGRMAVISYLAVALIGAGVGVVYWWTINKLYPRLFPVAAATQAAKTQETATARQPNVLSRLPARPTQPLARDEGTSTAGETPPRESIKILFKESPLLTESVRQRIRGDLARLRVYFISLGISVPAELPPIGVEGGRTGTSTAIQYPLPIYRANMMVGEKSINDPMAVTRAYTGYVVGELLRERRSLHPSAESLQDMLASSALSTYYNWSFWNNKPTLEGERWASPLWQIRQKFGAAFTDQMLAYTLKALVDTPEEEVSDDFDLYFYGKIRTGDSVIDNGQAKLPAITEILERSGLSVTKPKAELSCRFSEPPEAAPGTAAVQMVGDRVSLRLDIVNHSRVEARGGRFWLQIPGGKFATEPEGSTKSDRGEEERQFHFDSLPAGGQLTVTVEVAPRLIESRRFSRGFFVVFRYGCGTCADDSRSHMLSAVVVP